jgi:hypothetical protein
MHKTCKRKKDKKTLATHKRAIYTFVQMRKVHTGGTPLSSDEVWMEYVRFVKQCLRDLQPLNRRAVDVCSLIESALSGGEADADLRGDQRQLLIDIIHHLISMLRSIGKARHGEIIGKIEKRLNALVKQYDGVAA